jgi:hypothetical protein
MISKNNFLFWSENSQTPINRISLLGNQQSTALASTMGVVNDYLLAGEYIYWIDNQSTKYGNGFIKRSRLDDGTTTILYQVAIASWSGVTELYADTTNLYWVESIPDPNGVTTTSTIHQIKRMPLGGGTAHVVYSSGNGVRYLAGDDTNLYWVETTTVDMHSVSSLHRIGKDSNGHQVVLSNQRQITAKPLILGDTIYLALITGTTNIGDSVYSLASVPKSGGTLQILYSYSDYGMDGHSIRELAADSTYIYWIEYASVKKIAISGGAVITLASSVPSGSIGNVSLTLFGDKVFWADGKYIKSVASAGGSLTDWSTLHFWTNRIKSDTSGIYWDEWGNDANTTVRIAKLNPSTFKTDTVVTGIGSTWYPFSVDSSNIFIADGEAIKKVPVAGGRMEVVLEKDPYQIISNVYTDGTSVYFLAQQQLQKLSQATGTVGTIATGLVCDNAGDNNDSLFIGRYLYCVDAGSVSSGNKFFKVSLDTGAVSTIATNIGIVSDWTTDGTNLFYSDQDSGKVYKVSVNGGDVTTMFTTNGFDITKLASDGQYLYWINQTVFAKTNIASGSTEYIYIGLTGSANVIIVDADSIYWGVGRLNDGTIYLAKPK